MKINDHNLMLCWLANAHMHNNVQQELESLDTPERNVLKQDIIAGLEELLDGGLFRDFIDGNE